MSNIVDFKKMTLAQLAEMIHPERRISFIAHEGHWIVAYLDNGMKMKIKDWQTA